MRIPDCKFLFLGFYSVLQARTAATSRYESRGRYLYVYFYYLCVSK